MTYCVCSHWSCLIQGKSVSLSELDAASDSRILCQLFTVSLLILGPLQCLFSHSAGILMVLLYIGDPSIK